MVWYGPDGARVELSVKSLTNAADKAANLLGEELEPGDRVRIALPVHWQAAAWLAACAVGGHPVVLDADAEVALTVTADQRTSSAGRLALVSLDPFGMPTTPAPAGWIDAAREVRAQPDVLLGPPPSPAATCLVSDGRALDGEDVVAAAADLAAELRLGPGERFTLSEPVGGLRPALACLALPLVVAGTVVLVDPSLDPAVAAQERPAGHVG